MVALSIPVVLATVFIFMDLSDIALQRVSLGALIISLGLLVDDAMITVEMMIRKLEEGWTKAKAATHAYMTTHFPMGTGTLVTVAAFLPIGMAQSSAGEYLFSLFAVVAVALIASWFVAAIFTPLIGVVLLSEKHRTRTNRDGGCGLFAQFSSSACGGAGPRWRSRAWRSCLPWWGSPWCRGSSFHPPTGPSFSSTCSCRRTRRLWRRRRPFPSSSGCSR